MILAQYGPEESLLRATIHTLTDEYIQAAQLYVKPAYDQNHLLALAKLCDATDRQTALFSGCVQPISSFHLNSRACINLRPNF